MCVTLYFLFSVETRKSRSYRAVFPNIPSFDRVVCSKLPSFSANSFLSFNTLLNSTTFHGSSKPGKRSLGHFSRPLLEDTFAIIICPPHQMGNPAPTHRNTASIPHQYLSFHAGVCEFPQPLHSDQFLLPAQKCQHSGEC